MTYKRGMGLPLIIALLAGVFVIGGVAVYNMQPEEKKMMEEGEDMMKEGEDMMKEGEDMMKEGEHMMKEAEDMMAGETSMLKDGEEPIQEEFSGDRIGGSPKTPVLEYSDADYKKALESDKLIVLYFFANWCPTCKAEFPKMLEAFDSLDGKNVVGFRINYKDDQTEDAETELAREHGIGYQHTKVLIKDGERIQKSPESWDVETYISEITKSI